MLDLLDSSISKFVVVVVVVVVVVFIDLTGSLLSYSREEGEWGYFTPLCAPYSWLGKTMKQ